MMVFLKSRIGKRVFLAAIAAVALALSPMVPGDQKLKTAGIVFVVAFVALLMFKPGGGGKEQPAAAAGREGERSEGGGDGVPQGGGTGRPGRRAAVQAQAAVMEIGGVRSEDLLTLMRPDNQDEGLKRAATTLFWARMRDESKGYGIRLPVPDILRVDPNEENDREEVPEFPDTRGRADSFLLGLIKALLRR